MIKHTILILLISFLSIFIFACSNSDNRNNSFSKDDLAYRLTMVVPLANHQYWLKAGKGMKEASKKYGFNAQYLGSTELNIEKQIEYIEIAIAAKVDGIITQALNPSRFKSIISKASIAGIPLIIIDSNIPNSTRNYYVGTPNFTAGEVAGRAMIEATGGKAKIGIITGVKNQLNLIERIEGFKNTIKDYPDMQIVTTIISDIDFLKAIQITKKTLINYPEINAFFGASANDIQGAAKAISEKNNRNSYTLVGFDDMDYTIESIKNGLIYATVVQDPYAMGELAVELLNQIKTNTAPKEKIINTGFVLVTKENVDSYHDELNSSDL